jgi:tRNA 2-thiouridine synthesizing protein E
MLEANLQELRGFTTTPPADFPHAPPSWEPEAARQLALQEGLTLTPEHWEAIGALQEYYVRNADCGIHGRAMHDALDEHFHRQGGIKFLYRIFPGGPVAQGCRIAGLKAPFTATDQSFGSVM